ncbi:MAG TPA: tRNA (adenosine(37)-N6)-threonylcarbamoyltransferase complex ATPase subunit type 1 TsaE [Actinomycetota bacterium]|nr:tRNA (adenosine(37)-N6)-threonylcarbamoyltransferase complex ATPase subunit type 1 TsaE [Actinomycetota bacterium]
MPSQIVRDVETADAMVELGRLLGLRLRAGDVVLLAGDLGAGKTTLMRGVGEGLGVRGPITSPTFVIARRHPSEVGGPALVHADAYRLGSSAEFDDLDLDADDCVVCVEWGRNRAEGLADAHLLVEIETLPDGRRVTVTGVGREVPL